MNLKTIAFEKAAALARTALAGWVIREVFVHMSFIIPFERLCDTPDWMAFHHPSPSYPFHILLVAKRPYRSLLDIPHQQDSFLDDLLALVQGLVRRFELEKTGYRLISNGGSYQDVPILHFHLVSDRNAAEAAG